MRTILVKSWASATQGARFAARKEGLDRGGGAALQTQFKRLIKCLKWEYLQARARTSGSQNAVLQQRLAFKNR
jgi:hypothetical protein